MKIKAIHIDDEKDSIEVIQMLIKEHCPQLDLVAWAHTVNEGVELIEKHNPHLVFLDVEMPGENGFSLFSKLKHRSFHTIMVTGYENYAIKAMKHSALDYLLKPVDADSLESAVSKLDSKNLLEDPRLAHFNSLYQNELATIKSLMIMTQSGFKNILFKNIVFIKSESGGYSIFHLVDGSTEMVSKPLAYFEELLSAHVFLRVHRSHMVNLGKITSYDKKDSLVYLAGDVVLEVSVRKQSDLRKNMINI